MHGVEFDAARKMEAMADQSMPRSRERTLEDRIRYYCNRNNLMEQDAAYLMGLLREAIEEERQRCFDLADNCYVMGPDDEPGPRIAQKILCPEES